jgi:hypothetical protein
MFDLEIWLLEREYIEAQSLTNLTIMEIVK